MSFAPLSTVQAGDNLKRRACLRLAFGFAQISGATCGVILLIDTGLSAATITVVLVTGLVSLVSVMIFRPKR